MPGACLPSGWCDFSEEHRRVREAAEQLIEAYVEGGRDEYWMTVIVAPYGSGKTTLLRHLEWYAREKLGVPAARVELSKIVGFITETRGSVHESELPRVVEEFVSKTLAAEEGKPFILLVDEVEESYDVLKGIVEHETSPLRGLAEAIRTRSTWVYTVFAFGPSSTLKEAVFGPVAWRSRVLTIPLLPKAVVARELRSRGTGDPEAELLANMAWWASKGRVAWARLIVDSVAPRIREASQRGPEELEAVLLGDEALSREIVDGIPLLDRQGYREVRRLLEEKRLLPYLAAYPGPAPLPWLEERVGAPIVPEPGPVLGFTRSLASVDDILAEAEAWMERIARARGIQAASLEHAVSMLEHVLSAWSSSGMVPYDPQSLRELFSAAADLAREVYGDDPGAAQLLEALSPDILAPQLHRSEHPVVYLRPQMLLRIYPSASSSPLLGCARRSGLSQVVEVVESLAPEELEKAGAALAQLLGLEEQLKRHGLRLVVAPRPLLRQLRGTICSGGARSLVLLVDARNGVDRVPPWLEAAERIGAAIVVPMGQRVSMFIYSLLYSMALDTGGCSLEQLEPRDKRLITVYGDVVKSLVLDKLGEWAAKAARIEVAVSGTVARLGDAWARAAVELALQGDTGKARAQALDKAVEGLEAAARELAGLAGLRAPRLPRLGEAVASLAAVLGEAAGLGEDCLAAASPTLARLLEARPSGGAPSLERMEALASSLPGDAPAAAKLADALRRLREALEEVSKLGYGWLAAEALNQLLEPLEGLVERIARLYSGAEGRLQALPQGLRERVAEAVREDLSRAATLTDLLEYGGVLLQALEELASIAEKTAVLQEIEERRAKLIEQIDKIFAQDAAITAQRAGAEVKAA